MTSKSRSSSKIPIDTSRPRNPNLSSPPQRRKTSDDSTATLRVLNRRTNTLEKRTPRKLNRGNSNRQRDVSADTDAEDGYALGDEVLALKKKVGIIEKKLREIVEDEDRKSRGQQKRRRSLHDDGQEGFETLDHELDTARDELATLMVRNTHTAAKKNHNPRDEAEEIPRLPPGMVARRRPLGKAVTLIGSYAIPLPASERERDFETIKRGINAAQKVARGFMDETRGSVGFREELHTIASSPSTDPTSWTSWISGYTLSIARAVDKLQLTTTIETSMTSQPRLLLTGGAAGRSDDSTPPPRRKPRKLELRRRDGGRPVGQMRRAISEDETTSRDFFEGRVRESL